MSQPLTESDASTPPPDLRSTGARIDALLDASAAGGVVAHERAEELVRAVTDLYGAGLERVLTLLYDAGRLDGELLDLLADDELVSGLLIVHGLHPYDVEARVQRALDRVRPYLGSHGGDVELLGVDDEVVHLRLLGSCDGCPSSSVTLELAVKDAIDAAAPEITGIEVETDPGSDTGHGSGAPVIPVDALRSRIGPATEAVPSGTGAEWHLVSEVANLAAGEVSSAYAGQTALLVCRIASDLFAFLDRCARCGSDLGGAVLARRMGAAVGEAVLRCPSCGAHYDVRRAGACLDDTALHLDPLPLILNEEGASVSVPVSVAT